MRRLQDSLVSLNHDNLLGQFYRQVFNLTCQLERAQTPARLNKIGFYVLTRIFNGFQRSCEEPSLAAQRLL